MKEFDKTMSVIYLIIGVAVFLYLLSQLNSSHLWILELVGWVIGIFVIWAIALIGFNYLKKRK